MKQHIINGTPYPCHDGMYVNEDTTYESCELCEEFGPPEETTEEVDKDGWPTDPEFKKEMARKTEEDNRKFFEEIDLYFGLYPHLHEIDDIFELGQEISRLKKLQTA